MTVPEPSQITLADIAAVRWELESVASELAQIRPLDAASPESAIIFVERGVVMLTRQAERITAVAERLNAALRDLRGAARPS